jgi:hypothetical protein
MRSTAWWSGRSTDFENEHPAFLLAAIAAMFAAGNLLASWVAGANEAWIVATSIAVGIGGAVAAGVRLRRLREPSYHAPIIVRDRRWRLTSLLLVFGLATIVGTFSRPYLAMIVVAVALSLMISAPVRLGHPKREGQDASP